MTKLLGVILNGFIKKNIVGDWISINGGQIPIERFVDFNITSGRGVQGETEIEVEIRCNPSKFPDAIRLGDKVQMRVVYNDRRIALTPVLERIDAVYDRTMPVNKYLFVHRSYS